MIDKREVWARRMGLKCAGKKQLQRKFPYWVIEQLERCRSEEARRLLLGVSRKGETARNGIL